MLFRPSRSSSVLGITFILRIDPPCLLYGCSWVGRLFSDYTEEYLYYTFDSNVFFTLSIPLPIQVARFLPYQVVLAVLGVFRRRWYSCTLGCIVWVFDPQCRYEDLVGRGMPFEQLLMALQLYNNMKYLAFPS